MKKVIGKAAADRLAGLKALLSRIPDGGVDACASLLGEVERKAGNAACTLSIVGQVKAGKSTLINALTEVGDLLPTEVNPWTAVITNLHFGLPGRTPDTAAFTLFSEAEWERMLTGDAETRKLAQDFLPGYDAELLKEQVRAMQEGARERLGDMYHHLLGKTHRFSKVDRATLERYVCAGDGDDGDITAGRLSGVTKSADIYLRPGPFALPLTVVDTPGINDPFLVRDEITTGHLKAADVSVVAISAHQPMNEADIALLRMLARQSARRVVVFVNRCDELGVGITRVPALLDGLRERLAEAVGEDRAVLCAGSAHWGLAALRGTDEEVLAAVRSDAFAALQGGPFIGPVDRARELLDAASGMGGLRGEISRLLHDGPVAELVAELESQTAIAVDLVRQSVDAAISHERGLLDIDGPGGLRDETVAALEARREACASLTDRLPGLHAEWNVAFAARARAGKEALAEGLAAAVEADIAAARAELTELMAKDAELRRWSFDYERMRGNVDAAMESLYERTRAVVDDEAQRQALAVAEEVAPLLGAIRLDRLRQATAGGTVVPGFKPASKMVELDLSGSGWKFWSRKRIGAEEAGERLAKLLRAETKRAAEATGTTLSEALAARALALLSFLAEVSGALDANLRAEIDRLDRDLSGLRAGGTTQALEAGRAERAARLAALEEQAARLDEAEEALGPRAAAKTPAVAEEVA